ncbi:Enoyl-CoA hydratase/isomerase [Segniliparus rotundus DSM 44985]|uniref:3-hydroxyisobutyryl-CoA hydrolase n=1 Tax=Segniliparus rotundus (strain ATCC BAA-972 / CDC 1076 / CIP 108378 / DSM 44985 / JCM 13578) TaxID=640132 RepID=D6ZCF4_SEGRD|nr:enoyl-CoA hydratase/isomerase family protein [Segniliparus rotundus]ADG99123.1 Enoyl-CoA hydratase/isomerase [Segniliparus rotundus DSM 44985]
MTTVRVSLDQGVGRLVLDRPHALNALDLGMIRELAEPLAAWASDASVRRVVVTSSSPKAFCAGGDIRAIREHAVNGESGLVRQYFAEEYALNQLIAEYPKEYVAVIDGYALGGGLGISVHGSERIVTEHAVAAMPETAIGFFPDIGASFFLSRLQGELGTYLGLTGARLSGSDVVAAGLATRFVPRARLADATSALTSGVDSDSVWGTYTEEVPALALPLERIDAVFSGHDVVGVLGRIEEEPGDWAGAARTALAACSPTSLAVTLRLLREGAGSDLATCLARELDLATRLTATADFIEGVRAALVDKDRSPAWKPQNAADVAQDTIEALFRPCDT